MKRWLMYSVAAGLFAASPMLRAENDAKKAQEEQERLQSAHAVLQETIKVPEGIPQDLLNKARCVVVMPSVVKGAFIVGASYGHGVMVCRTGNNFSGPWGAPAMYALEGGSIGFQVGGSATDYVLLVMNEHGVNSLLKSKVKLGADLSAAAGPVGRSASASTDAGLRAEILSYSRSRGAFAGVSLEGSTLRPDDSANERLYARKLTATEIVTSSMEPPPAARPLIALLRQESPRLVS